MHVIIEQSKRDMTMSTISDSESGMPLIVLAALPINTEHIIEIECPATVYVYSFVNVCSRQR